MCSCEKIFIVHYQLGRNSARVYVTTVKAVSVKAAIKAVNKKLAKKEFRIVSVVQED